MMNQFNKHAVAIGSIFNSSTYIEDVKCELSYSKYNTRNIVVHFSNIDRKIKLLKEILDSNESLKFKSFSNNREIYLEGFKYNLNLSYEIGAKLVLFPTESIIIDKYEDTKPSEIRFTFFLPKSQIFKRSSFLVRNKELGLSTGWVKASSDNEDMEWDERKYLLKGNLGEMSITPGFEFEETNYEEIGFEATLVINQLYMKYKIDLAENDIDEVEVLVKGEINEYLKILSFLECRRMNWNYLNIFAINDESIPVFEKHIFNQIPKTKFLNQEDIHYIKWKSSYQKIYPEIVMKYTKLDLDTKKFIDRVIERYLVAFTHDKIDTKIIYALSCLDLLRNYAKVGNKPFTPKLIEACKKFGIYWLDLFDYLDEESIIKAKADMYLNEVRNNIIHEGHYPDDYTKAIEEVDKAKALCERFILRMLNINYENTGLGIVHQ
jgi:hypothetical protein